MKIVRKTVAAILLFLCAFSCLAASPKRCVSVQILADGAQFEREYELSAKLPFFTRTFTFDYGKLAKRLKGKNPNDAAVLEKMFSGIIADIDGFCADNVMLPQNATVSFAPDAKIKFNFTAEKNGREINKTKLYESIITGLNKRAVSVRAGYTVLYPQITREEVQRNTVRRGGFKTYFGASGAARQENIVRAAGFINGVRVAAGDTFSFNNTVGRRTSDRGYKEAPIIVDGKFIGGVGGGVCQVSTTLYNAVLYSDLAVNCVARHSLPVKYVQPSFDAMVSGVSDFKFSNDTGYDIFLQANCSGGYLEITVYGAPLAYEIRLVSETSGAVPRVVEYVTDDTLAAGEERVIAEGADGVISRGYLEKWAGNVRLQRVLIRRDTYNSQKKVIAKSAENTAENTIKD